MMRLNQSDGLQFFGFHGFRPRMMNSRPMPCAAQDDGQRCISALSWRNSAFQTPCARCGMHGHTSIADIVAARQQEILQRIAGFQMQDLKAARPPGMCVAETLSK